MTGTPRPISSTRSDQTEICDYRGYIGVSATVERDGLARKHSGDQGHCGQQTIVQLERKRRPRNRLTEVAPLALARPSGETAGGRRSEIMEYTRLKANNVKPWIIERPRCANGTTRIPRSPAAAIPLAR